MFLTLNHICPNTKENQWNKSFQGKNQEKIWPDYPQGKPNPL